MSKSKHPIFVKRRSQKNPFRHLLFEFEACYEIILLWRSRRQVKLRKTLLGEILFRQLASISECDSTIQERLIDIQNDDEARVIFHTHGG